MGDGILADARALRRGETDPVQLVDQALTALGRWEPHIRCAVTVLEERAQEAARQRRAELETGIDRGPLHGIPIAVKDLIDIAGVRTTAGSQVLRDNVATASAPVIRALEQAGAIPIAKTNTHEFAFGALTPPTRNPYDRSLMPGGSSGGSAAIVGAGVVSAALGSDTAGSIREPAALCGAVGLKPTAGRIDLQGVIPLAWSLDAVGPISGSVEDAAATFTAMSPRPGVPQGQAAMACHTAGARLAVWGQLGQRMQAPVREVYERSLHDLADAGARLQEVSLGEPDELVAAALVVLGAEALSYHRRWLADRRSQYQPDVLAYLDLAAGFTAVDLVDAERVRHAFTGSVDATLERYDAVITPAQLVLPPAVTDDEVVFDDDRRGPRDLTLIRPLAAFNLSGHPAVSVPIGYTPREGLPVSLQLVGPAGTDETLLALAGSLQRACGFQRRLPQP